MVFLPGFLLLKYLRFEYESKIQTIIYSFGLSLLINYLLVYGLTVLKLYKPGVMYVIFLAEILLLFLYLKNNSSNRKDLDIKDPARQLTHFLKGQSLYYNVLLLGSVIFILVYADYFVSSFGSVFTRWDAMVSWNRWAVSWSANQLPTMTYRYPQLIPANWSMSYVMMQTVDVQLFAKSIMSLFPIATLLLFLDLALRKRDLTYLIALLIYGGIIRAIFTPAMIVDGYVDIAITFFAFLAFHALYSNQRNQKNMLLAFALACAAAVTKQAGIYILVIILGWVIFTLIKEKNQWSFKAISRTSILLVLILMIIVLSWYIYISVQIDKKVEISEKNGIIHAMNQVHGDRTPGQRFIYGFEKLLKKGDFNSGLIFAMVLFFLLFALTHKKSRAIVLAIVIPYTLIWGYFFSYDNRNLALAFPFIAFACAYGFRAYLGKLFAGTGTNGATGTYADGYTFSWIYLSLFIVSVAVFLNMTIYSKSNLINNQYEQRTQIGVPRLNKLLYDYLDSQGYTGKIFSAYQYLAVLPKLKDLYVPLPYYEKITVKKHIDGVLKAKDIHYFLVLKRRIKPSAQKRIDEKIKNGEYKPIFNYKGYQLFKIK
jgi:hypothetical protein